MSSRARRELRALAGPDGLHTDPEECWVYGYDSGPHRALPEAVFLVQESSQVAGIVRLCNRLRIPLTARGRGTGTTGAAVPERGGIVLSFERMTGIGKIDPANRLAVVEPGLTNQALQQALGNRGFFWPPDPSSAPVCTVGGNLACSAAGPRTLKYGTARENTLGLKAVTGAGEEIRTGVCTTKGVVGYDLTRLIIGSEGTLALITEATLKLTPLPEAKRTLRASYRNIEAAAKAVASIMAQPLIPCALELMDGAAIEAVRGYVDIGLAPAAGALLMIEVDGPEEGIEQAVRALTNAASVAGVVALDAAREPTQLAALWKARRALAPALRRLAPHRINEDIVVPVSHLAKLINGLQRLSREAQIPIVNFGHAGNGNIHVNLLVDPEDGEQMARAGRCLEALFSLVVGLGGTISGEHGVGIAKRDQVQREIDPITLDLMHRIRRQFDPNGILNPGKSLPEVGAETGGLANARSGR